MPCSSSTFASSCFACGSPATMRMTNLLIVEANVELRKSSTLESSSRNARGSAACSIAGFSPRSRNSSHSASAMSLASNHSCTVDGLTSAQTRWSSSS
jgi:hypothetical protein